MRFASRLLVSSTFYVFAMLGTLASTQIAGEAARPEGAGISGARISYWWVSRQDETGYLCNVGGGNDSDGDHGHLHANVETTTRVELMGTSIYQDSSSLVEVLQDSSSADGGMADAVGSAVAGHAGGVVGGAVGWWAAGLARASVAAVSAYSPWTFWGTVIATTGPVAGALIGVAVAAS